MICRRCEKRAGRGMRGFCDAHYRALPDVGYIPAAPVRDHIIALLAEGWTLAHLAHQTGLDWTGIQRIYNGQYARVEKRTRDLLMAVEVTGSIVNRGAQRLPNVGVRRRLQALAAFGYSMKHLGEEMGVTEQCINHWHQTPLVYAETIEKVAHLFDRLATTPGPSKRAVNHAKRKGWPLPLEWDDDSIDDPSATPSGRRPEDVEEAPAKGERIGHPIPGHLDRYEAFRDGTILARGEDTHYMQYGKLRTRRSEDAVLVPYINNHNPSHGRYPVVKINMGRLNTKGHNYARPFRVSKLIALAFLETPFEVDDTTASKQWRIDHIDGDYANCAVDNLRWIRTAPGLVGDELAFAEAQLNNPTKEDANDVLARLFANSREAA